LPLICLTIGTLIALLKFLPRGELCVELEYFYFKADDLSLALDKEIVEMNTEAIKAMEATPIYLSRGA